MADRGVLREGAQDRTRRAPQNGQELHHRGRHRQAANCQPGRQTLPDKLQTGLRDERHPPPHTHTHTQRRNIANIRHPPALHLSRCLIRFGHVDAVRSDH